MVIFCFLLAISNIYLEFFGSQLNTYRADAALRVAARKPIRSIMSKPHYVLTLSCLNRPGIVAAVTTCLFEHGADIREAQQYDDAETKKFFARIAFDLAGGASLSALRDSFTAVAETMQLS